MNDEEAPPVDTAVPVKNNNSVETPVVTSSTIATTTNVVVEGQTTDVIITKQQNIPIVECIAIAAIISGSLSMYWGISGVLLVGTATSTISSMIISMIVSQPMTIVHVLMSTCVVILAPVVTVQKVQLRVLGTLREQQNELRVQVNTLQQTNDELSLSISTVVDETNHIQQITDEIQVVARNANTTVDQLISLCTEQEQIQKKIYNNLQAKVIQQIIMAILQTDVDRNYCISKQEVSVLLERLKHISGIIVNEDAFRSVINQSEPKGELSLSDLMTIVRDLQHSNRYNDTTQNNDHNNETTKMSHDPIFTFQPSNILKST